MYLTKGRVVRTMCVFDVLTGGSMKVFLLRWVYEDDYNIDEGVLGIYKDYNNADVEGKRWAEIAGELYHHTIEEMELND